ncbi:MAG: VUT family protein [Alphaproteobacteria bacterium]|nr:VUT family protein [Alphaproteobacteria bacterium]
MNNKIKNFTKIYCNPFSMLAKLPIKIKSIDFDNYFHYLAIAFVTFLTLSNIAVTKICDFYGNIMPGGMVFFSFLYVINDVVTEIYGFQKGRRMIFLGLLATIIFNFLLYIVVLIPPAPGVVNNDAFDKVFSFSPRIFTASLISYFIGENINAIILTVLKRKYNGKIFVFRAVLSTFVGSMIEGSLFFAFIFWNILDSYTILKMILTTSIIKVGVEILVMPVSICLISLISRSGDYISYTKPHL